MTTHSDTAAHLDRLRRLAEQHRDKEARLRRMGLTISAEASGRMAAHVEQQIAHFAVAEQTASAGQ